MSIKEDIELAVKMMKIVLEDLQSQGIEITQELADQIAVSVKERIDSENLKKAKREEEPAIEPEEVIPGFPPPSIPPQKADENAPIPPGAELLWVLSSGEAATFTQYIQNFPDASLQAYARNPQALRTLIQRLDESIHLPAGEVEDGVPRASPNSSNVYGFQYNAANGKLRVRFQNGGIYDYTGVPPAIFKMFSRGAIPAKTQGHNQYGAWWVGKTPSLGASFYDLIRLGGFPYQRVA